MFTPTPYTWHNLYGKPHVAKMMCIQGTATHPGGLKLYLTGSQFREDAGTVAPGLASKLSRSMSYLAFLNSAIEIVAAIS